MSNRQRSIEAREREQRAWSLTLRGRTQDEVARELGISQPTVSKILARVEARVSADLASDAQNHRLRQSARLEYLYREAVDAWEFSKPTASVPRHTAAVGDRRFLAEARSLLADLRRLWGLDAPVKVEAPSCDRPFLAMSDEELLSELAGDERIRRAVLRTGA